MNNPDPVALSRHHAFGSDQASVHHARYPAARFTVPVLLDLFREQMLPIAGDSGFGSKASDPLIRASVAGFMRRWRSLQRADDSAGWVDWPATE